MSNTKIHPHRFGRSEAAFRGRFRKRTFANSATGKFQKLQIDGAGNDP